MRVILITFAILLTSCNSSLQKHTQKYLNIKLSDSVATLNTVALYYNLKKLSENKIIFGHHHSTAYGIGWSDEEDRSDVKDVTGVFPGLIGWDFADLNEGGPVNPDNLYKLVVDVHNKGLVNIFAWHLNNLATGNSFYDTTVVVKHIISGGKYHKAYKKELDRVAQFTKHLIGNDGKIIPIIFRPFHEFDGFWFWWGKNFCTKEEFVTLWKFTVEYLRDVRNCKNIIYAFSPDRNFSNEEEYLDRYPGDEYVDLIGMDDYWDFTPDGDGSEAITQKLKIISNLAKKKNKIAAFTETGLEKVPDPNWWTDKLLKVMDHDSIKISFVMVWRNYSKGHFYVPYKNHPSASNFLEFKSKRKIVFADELPKLYSVQ